MQQLPNFLYVGAAKAGSTWIYRALRAHPQVFVPAAKDLYFFDDHYDRGLAWYRSFFAEARTEHAAVGELSHFYLYSTAAAERIARDLPQVRIIASLRNPIERAWSAYLFQRRNGTAKEDFEATIEAFPHILERGRYTRWIELYRGLLGPERVAVFLFDDLNHDPHAFAAAIYGFLGVDAAFPYDAAERKVLPASAARLPWLAGLAKRAARGLRQRGHANLVGLIKGSALTRLLYRPIAQRERESLTRTQWAQLADYYADDVAALGRLLGRDLGHWLATPDSARRAA